MAMNLNMAGGAQGMMKEGSTLADGVDEAVLKNIGVREPCINHVRRDDGVRGCGRVDGVWRHPYAIAATLRHHGDGVAHRSRAQVEGKQGTEPHSHRQSTS